MQAYYFSYPCNSQKTLLPVLGCEVQVQNPKIGATFVRNCYFRVTDGGEPERNKERAEVLRTSARENCPTAGIFPAAGGGI